MANIIEDIIKDKQQKLVRGVHEVYYKKDISEGVLLIIRLIGILGLVAALGAAAFGAIASIVSVAAGNPQMAAKVWKMLAYNKDEIISVFQSGGKSLDKKYQELGPKEKKYVQTVLLLVSGNLDWDDLN